MHIFWVSCCSSCMHSARSLHELRLKRAEQPIQAAHMDKRHACSGAVYKVSRLHEPSLRSLVVVLDSMLLQRQSFAKVCALSRHNRQAEFNPAKSVSTPHLCAKTKHRDNIQCVAAACRGLAQRIADCAH